jgi:hypothetical protein
MTVFDAFLQLSIRVEYRDVSLGSLITQILPASLLRLR